MTGHQEHAGTEDRRARQPHYIQDIEADRPRHGRHQPADRREALARPTATTYKQRAGEDDPLRRREGHHRRQGMRHHLPPHGAARKSGRSIKEQGYLPRKTHMNITPEVCEDCLECTKADRLPGPDDDRHRLRPKIDTDLTWCVNDGACERVRTSNELRHERQACPSFEQVTVVRQKRRRYTLPHMALDKLPEPTPVHAMNKPGDAWRVHMAGVGGMGIGVVGAILVRAGHKEGYRVIFAGQEGPGDPQRRRVLADHVREGRSKSARCELDGCDAANHGQDARATVTRPPAPSPTARPTCCSASTSSKPPARSTRASSSASRRKDRTCRRAQPAQAADGLHAARQGRLRPREAPRRDLRPLPRRSTRYAKNLSELCEQRLGSKQYVNIMMLGVAYPARADPGAARTASPGRSRTRSAAITARTSRRSTSAASSRSSRGRCRTSPSRRRGSSSSPTRARILRKTRLFGRSWADAFRAARAWRDEADARPAGRRQVRPGPAHLRPDAVPGRTSCAKRYVELVRSVYQRDCGRAAVTPPPPPPSGTSPRSC